MCTHGTCYGCSDQTTTWVWILNRSWLAIFHINMPGRRELYNENPFAWLLWHWSSRGHFGTLQPTRPLGRIWVQSSTDRVNISVKEPIQMGFWFFIPHLKSRYSHLILSNPSRISSICPTRSPWQLIVLVGSLRSAWLNIAWLVKSVTYFDLIGQIGGCGRDFSIPNTHFPNTLKPWNLRASVR